MTIGIRVSCNGSYKCPVKVTQGTMENEFLLEGKKTAPLPDERYVSFNHGGDSMTLVIGPEEYDPEVSKSEGTTE